MSNNIGGQDGNLNIRLFNGRTINLKKLDKLVGSGAADGSIFAKFDHNGNNILDEDEIAQIKNHLMQYNSNDNTVSQYELNLMFGYGQIDKDGNIKNFDANNLTSLLDSIPEDEIQEQKPVSQNSAAQNSSDNQPSTSYTVQVGDTFIKIAHRLGLKGQEAKNYANQLKSSLQANNQLDKHGWMRVGQKINLPGDYKAVLANDTEYSEDINVLQERYVSTTHGQRTRAAVQPQDAASVQPKPKKNKAAAPPPPKDNTPASQRITISSVKNQGKVFAKELKDQIEPWGSSNDETRALLQKRITNRNIAYILENYPDLVTDIDDEWGMDKNDVKKYVVDALNNRLRELGLNKHCMPDDLSKVSVEQIQQLCSKNAELIRKTDAENGYVFKPAAGEEGKIHKPRKASQAGQMVTPKTKTVSPQQANAFKPEQKEITLTEEEKKYPKEMQDFILQERKKGIEYTVTKKGREYSLMRQMGFFPKNNNNTNPLMLNKPFEFNNSSNPMNMFMPVTFKVDVPFKVQDKLDELKGTDANMAEDAKGNYTITQTGSDGGKITYKYNADGAFQYQLNASATDGSVMIGRINKKTGKLEFTQFKNSRGILQQIPDKVSQKWNEMLQDGGQARIIKGKETFTIVQSSGTYLTQHNLAKIEHKYNPFGVLIEQVYTYKNGRTEKYYDASTKGNDAAHIPNPIQIVLPDQYTGVDTDDDQMIYGLNTKGPKDTAQRFSGALASNKASLMARLHLTNEEYDNLAVLAMGIAEQETHFGQPDYVDTKGGEHSQDGLTDRATAKYYANKFAWSESDQEHHSQGITQINYSDAIKEPGVKKAFEAYGINSFKDLKESPEKQAVATMILLRTKKNAAEGANWQARLKENNARISDPNKRLTTNDVIALLWNGAGGVVKRMNAGETITIDTTINKDGLKGTFYAKAVRTYADRFFASPATQMSGAQHTTKSDNIAGALGATAQDNGGALGEVVFMPRSYSNASRTASTQSQINDAKKYISANTQLSEASKNLLLSYIDNGSIGFGNKGLTQDEAISISENDVQLITKHVNAVNGGSMTAVQANSAFEQEYLRSREFTVTNNSISRSSMISSVRSANPRDSKIAGTLDFEIHSSFYNGGNARHSARYTSHGADANSNVFAVTRSQGVNPYLADGTVVADKYRVAAEHAEYTATELFESSGRCKTGVAVDLEYSMGIDHRKIRGKNGRSLPQAKMLTEFYNAHPEVFSAVKYVNNGDGTSRELNATDIHNLPCGYFGVFSPGKGFENEAGHAFVSDGFGGAFADEHDNGKWTHMPNGKGEHGKLNVYGLSDSVVAVYSEKLGRKVNVPLNINPWYLTPEFRELQAQECRKRGLEVPEYKEEFPI